MFLQLHNFMHLQTTNWSHSTMNIFGSKSGHYNKNCMIFCTFVANLIKSWLYTSKMFGHSNEKIIIQLLIYYLNYHFWSKKCSQLLTALPVHKCCLMSLLLFKCFKNAFLMPNIQKSEWILWACTTHFDVHL